MWYRLSYGAVPPLRFPCNTVRAEGTENFKALERGKCHFLKSRAVSVWEEHFPSLEGGMLIGREHRTRPGLAVEYEKPPIYLGSLPLNRLNPMLVLCDHIRLWVQKEALAQCKTKFLF